MGWKIDVRRTEKLVSGLFLGFSEVFFRANNQFSADTNLMSYKSIQFWH